MVEWEEYKEDCCIVVPVYKKNLVFYEQASLIQCVRVLGQRYDVCLVAPFGLDLSAYTSLCPGYKFKIKRLAKGFFEGIEGYNQLCKRWEFYNLFSDYQFILVYQLDCWVFSDNLEYFMSLGYDYIGAPWLEIDTKKNEVRITQCGNGGFSLRRVDKCIELCKKYEGDINNESIPEDVFFSKNCKGEINVSPPEVGREFSFEVGPSALFKLNNNKLPMGCHKPYLFEFNTFWKDYIKF